MLITAWDSRRWEN